jgi:hypothetical protein
MDNEPQPETNRQPEDTAAPREPVDSGRQVFASDGFTREKRVAEPVVATDGQLVEAGYGHGV